MEQIPTEVMEKVEEAGMKMFPSWANAQSGHSDLYERFIQAAEFGYRLLCEGKEKEIAELKKGIMNAIDVKDEYKEECKRLKHLIHQAWMQAEDNVCIEHGMYDKDEFEDDERPQLMTWANFQKINNL